MVARMLHSRAEGWQALADLLAYSEVGEVSNVTSCGTSYHEVDYFEGYPRENYRRTATAVFSAVRGHGAGTLTFHVPSTVPYAGKGTHNSYYRTV